MAESSTAVLPMDRTARAAPYDLDLGVIYTGERHFMTPLIESLARSGDGLSMRLVLVDNATPDGVAPWQQYFRHTHVVRNEKRLRYGPNLNRILEVTNARYTLLLNTDMLFVPHEQCLTKMVSFMDRNPQCGLSVCRLYHADGAYAWPARRYQRWHTIAARRLPGAAALLGGSVQSYLYQHHNHLDTFECDWVSGCFMMVRRETLAQVGGLDLQFVKYFEDVDYCAMVRKAGWQVLFHGGTYCYHFEARDSKRLFSRDAWLHLQSYARFLRKWGLHPPAAADVPVLPPVVPAAPQRRAA